MFFIEQGELMDTIVGSRYPVNCISVNTDHLIAVGDCGGNLRIYQKLENNLVNIVTSIDIAAFFKQHLQSEDNQSNPGVFCSLSKVPSTSDHVKQRICWNFSFRL